MYNIYNLKEVKFEYLAKFITKLNVRIINLDLIVQI